MNTRLQKLYASIETSNKKKFLKNKVKLDNTWGTSIWGMTLQIDLCEEVKDVLDSYQQALAKLESDNFLLLPRQYQHISFNQVVFWDGEYKLGKQKTWADISVEFVRSFEKQDKKLRSFQITFSKLIATTGGIIWCAYDDNDQLESLREKFLEVLPFPKETTKLNHIIHTTVARHKSKLNNPEAVLDYIDRQKDSTQMTVDKIVLRKELIFPSIKTEEISSIELI